MNSDKRNYTHSDALLRTEAGLILAATTAYPAINARLLPGYVATTQTLLDQTTFATNAQSNNTTELTGLTTAQNNGLATITRLTALATRCAKTAFRGDKTKLREQFGVADGTRTSLSALTARALKIHAGCVDADNLPGMTEQGWIAPDSDALEAAILALTGADSLQELRKAVNKGDTAAYIQLLNQLHFNITGIQNASRIQYHEDTPANIAPRIAFRHGLYPPKENRFAPTIPQKFKVNPAAPGSLTLNLDWNIATRAADYFGTVKDKLTGTILTTFTTTDNKHTLVLTGTAPGTELDLTLIARNEAGESRPTKTVTAVVP